MKNNLSSFQVDHAIFQINKFLKNILIYVKATVN